MDKAIEEADNKETISWDDFKKEMDDWRKKIIITKRFRNNTLRVYQYLLKEFSSKTAYKFLQQLENRIEFIAKNPTVGKLSVKRKMFAVFYLHRITRFFTATKRIPLKYFASLI